MGIINDHQLIADTLANFYEKHFESPSFDVNRIAHAEPIKNYKTISQLPIGPMTNIALEEVEKNWKRAQKKKSIDSEGVSAFLLHKIPNGLCPGVNKLRPISLLSNFGKCFEGIIHIRILRWCSDNGIYIDEQSGFTSERRFQTRILSLVEDLRLTIAANNKPALLLFVDFM
ncbi:unnamed protein product [Rotaria magnacalcarata]|nr:unnamed protein product [Rotaria magnacalcarata]CAF4157869.1 unnamed protein product [Rotaria magnacalcarata]